MPAQNAKQQSKQSTIGKGKAMVKTSVKCEVQFEISDLRSAFLKDHTSGSGFFKSKGVKSEIDEVKAMNEWLGTIILAGIIALDGSAAAKGPEVTNVDNKISISADAITLDRLLRLWDQATGMQSELPAELAKRKLSVHFTKLGVNDALRKMFDGQPFDYVLIGNHGIVVTARSQKESIAGPVPVDNHVTQITQQPVSQQSPSSVTRPPEQPPMVIQTPFGPIWIPSSGPQPVVQPPQPLPTIIQTPFGPILNPSGGPQPVVQLPPVFGAPPPPFFAPTVPTTPPAGAPNGPAQNTLFGPLPIYQNPGTTVPVL